MRSVAITLLACAGAFGLAGVAHAGSKVVVKTGTYPVAGKSGREIMASMQRGGPRDGLQARAMAATRYDVKWNMDWSKTGGGCRLNSANATLYLTYNFPRLGDRVSPDLQARWTKFMSGVRTHEQVHGRIAQEMVNAAQTSVTGITVANDSNCSKAKNEARRRIQSVFADYEARQRGFDAKEHQHGGNVDGLVSMLTRT